MIRKIKITDKEQYLQLLAQLTTVGEISDGKWFLLFQKLEQTGVEIYVFVAFPDSVSINNNNTMDSDDESEEMTEQAETILAAGTLLLEQKVIHGGSLVGHIEDVVVAEKARGLGLGKEIVNFLVSRAKEAGAYKVILDTKEDTAPFYEKCGFRKHEIQMRLNLQ
jgi:glucosamine-phosphate N-acetyltransferase